MLYRVSLTGNHNRFSVPQLGYLGYHCLTLINLIGISATDLADCKEQNSRGLLAAERRPRPRPRPRRERLSFLVEPLTRLPPSSDVSRAVIREWMGTKQTSKSLNRHRLYRKNAALTRLTRSARVDFQTTTPWSRTGVSEKPKALWVSHLQAPSPQKSCLNWSTLVHKTCCSLYGSITKVRRRVPGLFALFRNLSTPPQIGLRTSRNSEGRGKREAAADDESDLLRQRCTRDACGPNSFQDG
jgi:hypothetical protein